METPVASEPDDHSAADAPPTMYSSPDCHQLRPSHNSRELPLDIIDRMDESVPRSLLHHHSGPFDPVTRSAYLPPNRSPLAALQHSTEEALKATPIVSIRDSLNKHVPLQNTAVVSPGEPVPGGLPNEVLSYEEENLIGDVGRWEGIEYDDNDRRAKGRPGWDGAFMNRGRNDADRAGRQDKHDRHYKKCTIGSWRQRPYGPESVGVNEETIEMFPPHQHSGANITQSNPAQEAESRKHHGIMKRIKRRLSLKRHHPN